MYIARCTGKDCLKKERCMHFTWLPEPSVQKYFDIHPLKEEYGQLICREFIPNYKVEK
jgi:hypothetical protein